MEFLGAKVVQVDKGKRTLTEAVNEALKYYIENVEDTHYLLGSALGPDPFPTIVRDYQMRLLHALVAVQMQLVRCIHSY